MVKESSYSLFLHGSRVPFLGTATGVAVPEVGILRESNDDDNTNLEIFQNLFPICCLCLSNFDKYGSVVVACKSNSMIAKLVDMHALRLSVDSRVCGRCDCKALP